MREPNILLDAIIDEARMSHDGLAARVNRLGARDGLVLLYDHASVRRWIRDGTSPRGRVPELICEVLGARLGRSVMLADIGMERLAGQPTGDGSLGRIVDHATALWHSDFKQAAALRAAAPVRGPSAIAPVFEWENPPDDLDVARREGRGVDVAQVRFLRAARTRYERMYREAGGIPVRPRVVAFLNDSAAPLLKGSYDDGTGRQLYRAVGGLTALAGICAYDADLQGVAQRYFFHSLRMAKASGDRGFGGYVVALLANQALYLGLHRQVIQYAETALRGARQYLTPALVTDLNTLQEMASRIRPGDEPPETGYVQPGLVEVQYADALARLGDLTAACGYAERAVAGADECHLRGQLHRLATLATILAGQGEADTAANIAGQMLDKAVGMESCRIQDRIVAVRNAVTAVSDGQAACDLSERVEDVIGVPM
jgi:hypothetical protein